MKLKLRALAAVLALALALTAAGCHTSTPDTVGRVGGVEISSGLYLLAQFDAYQSAAQYAGDGQDPADVKAFLAETITPDGGESVTVSDYVADETLNDLRRFAAVETRFAELGQELSPAYADQAEQYTSQLVENYGELYAANGIGEESLRRYEENLFKQAALVELLYGENGETPLTDEELTDHLENGMLFVRYVTVPLYNATTFAFADQAQADEMRALAEKAAAQATPDTFDEVMAQALPGICAVLDSELTAEDAAAQIGSSFLTSSDLDSSFSAEAADALRALQVGQTAVVDYGSLSLLAAMRLDPLETMTLDEARSTVLADLGTARVEEDMAALGESLAADLDGSAMAKLPAGRIKMSV